MMGPLTQDSRNIFWEAVGRRFIRFRTDANVGKHREVDGEELVLVCPRPDLRIEEAAGARRKRGDPLVVANDEEAADGGKKGHVPVQLNPRGNDSTAQYWVDDGLDRVLCDVHDLPLRRPRGEERSAKGQDRQPEVTHGFP